MEFLRAKCWLPAAALIGVSFLPSQVNAMSLASSTRSIGSTNRTTPGGYVDSLSSTTSNGSTTISQDTAISLFASLINVTGNGITHAQQSSQPTSSLAYGGESFLDANFSPLTNAQYVLSGILTSKVAVPLSGTPQFDNSTVSIQLDEIGGPTIFSFGSNGSYNKTGFFTAGKTYHLRVDSKLSLQTRGVFDKSNSWTVNFIASEVPEPSTIMLGVWLLAGILVRPRRV